MRFDADPPSSIDVRVMVVMLLVGVAHADDDLQLRIARDSARASPTPTPPRERDEYERLAPPSTRPRGYASLQLGVGGIETQGIGLAFEGGYFPHPNLGARLRATVGSVALCNTATHRDARIGAEARRCGAAGCGFVGVDVGYLREYRVANDSDGFCGPQSALDVSDALVAPHFGVDIGAGSASLRVAIGLEYAPSLGVGGSVAFGLTLNFGHDEGRRRRERAVVLARRATWAGMRGDCTAVREIVAKVESTDRAVSELLVQDLDVSECIEKTRPTRTVEPAAPVVPEPVVDEQAQRALEAQRRCRGIRQSMLRALSEMKTATPAERNRYASLIPICRD